MVNRHGGKYPFRPHPEESEKTGGHWIQNTQGYVPRGTFAQSRFASGLSPFISQLCELTAYVSSD